MKIYLLLIFICTLISTSCQRSPSNIFNGNIKYVEIFPKIDTLIGIPIEINNMGANTIHIIDSFMVFAGSRLDTFYSVSSKNNYQHLGNYVPKGRGDSELSNISFPMFCENDSNGIKIYLQDRANTNIKILNLTLSAKTKKTVFEKETIDLKYLPGIKFVFLMNDSTLFAHFFDYKSKKECYALINRYTHGIIRNDTVYTHKLNNTGNIFLWNTNNCMNTDKTKYVTAMQFFNQINIYELKNGDAVTIIPGRKITQQKEVEDKKMPDKIEYYVDLISGNDYFFGLYANQTRKDWAINETLSTEIHVFDWNGNPKMKLILPEKINKIALDEEQKILYGMATSEKVYKYKYDY